MSRSNNTDKPNPADRFYQWDGAKGGFSYWDKDKEERIPIGLPFRFLVLDCLATIKGWSDPDQSGYWANEIRERQFSDGIFIVRTKKGQKAQGHYKDVKAQCPGSKFCQSVYIADKRDDGFHIANVQLMGAALSSWIEFRKKHKDVYAGAITVLSMSEGKKGAVTYQMPVFGFAEVSPESNAIAMDLDKDLQDYLDGYMERRAEPQHAEPVTNDYEPPMEEHLSPEQVTDEEDPLPF